MRGKDQRKSPRLDLGVADCCLAPRFDKRWNFARVLRFRRQVLTGITRRRGVPAPAPQQAAPPFIPPLHGTHTNGKPASEKGIVPSSHVYTATSCCRAVLANPSCRIAFQSEPPNMQDGSAARSQPC